MDIDEYAEAVIELDDDYFNDCANALPTRLREPIARIRWRMAWRLARRLEGRGEDPLLDPPHPVLAAAIGCLRGRDA